MLKKSILTPVLSGVLAVTVVGSGAYYFMNQKSADKDDDESSSQSQDDSSKKDKDGGADVDIKVNDAELQAGIDKAADKLDEVKDGVTDQVDTVTKAMTGDLDYAYNASLTVTPGEVIAGEVDLKSFAINASAKQKGEASQFTLQGVYDGKTLATANIIGDRSGGNLYAQVPELSSSYVSVSAEQLKSMMEQTIQAPMQAYTQKAADVAAENGGEVGVDRKAAPDYKELLAAFETIDSEALEQDLLEYVQAAAAQFPEGKDAEATKGEVDGVSYELTTKTYDVTQGDALNVYKAVLEKAKDDSLIKDFLDQDVIKQTTGTNGSADFVTSIDELIKELDEAADDASAEAVSFDVMFDADGSIAGFKMDVDNEGVYAVVANVDSNIVVDIKFDGGDDVQMAATGVIKNENDTLNGSVKFTSTSKNNESGDMTMVYTLENVKTTDDVMTGTVKFDVTASGKTVGMVFTSNSTADKTDLLFSSTMDGKSIFDIAFTLEQTDASDITIPTDAIAIDLETQEGVDKYAATLDVEGFQANIKDALGEELYNQIMGSSKDVIDDAQTITKVPEESKDDTTTTGRIVKAN